MYQKCRFSPRALDLNSISCTSSHSPRISLVCETWMKSEAENSRCIPSTPRHAGISFQQMISMLERQFSQCDWRKFNVSVLFSLGMGWKLHTSTSYNRENWKWKRRKTKICVFASEESQPHPQFTKHCIAIKILEGHWHCPGFRHFHPYPKPRPAASTIALTRLHQ